MHPIQKLKAASAKIKTAKIPAITKAVTGKKKNNPNDKAVKTKPKRAAKTFGALSTSLAGNFVKL